MANKNDNTLHFEKVRVELSPEACEYLGGITNGLTIWNIYSELLNQLSQNNGTIVKRGILITLSEGELDCSVNSLCKRLGIGPKPMTKVLDRFVELGLIRRTPSKLASIADMVSVVGWTDEDGYHELCHSGEQKADVLQSHTDAVEDNPSPLVIIPMAHPLSNLTGRYCPMSVPNRKQTSSISKLTMLSSSNLATFSSLTSRHLMIHQTRQIILRSLSMLRNLTHLLI